MRNFRYGARILFQHPAFSIGAVLVLSLGIGGSTAIFSLLNTMFFKPLLVRDPAQLVGVYSRDTQKPDSYRAFSYPNYADLRAQNTVFSRLMAHDLVTVGITEGETTRRSLIEIVSSNYFATLGVPLAMGRAFNEAEERPGSGIPVVVVSDLYWEKHGSDPALIGKTVEINRKAYTIVGIAPRGFTGYTALLSPELYLPLGVHDSVANDFGGAVRPLAARDGSALLVVGRLKPGVTPKQADSVLAVVAARLAAAFPAENKNQTFIVHSLSRLSMGTAPSSDTELSIPSLLLLTMAGIVLLIASLNVASMMLARGTARRREIGIRMALGARRSTIARQLFSEALVLSGIGAIGGIGIAYLGAMLVMHSMQSALARIVPFDLVLNASPDLRVAVAAAAFCVLSALIFGLGPARSLSQIDIVTDIKDGELRDRVRSKIFSRGGVLVGGQIALSFVLLTAAGLFLRSSLRAAHVEPGFRIDHQILAELDPSLAGYNETRGREFYRALLTRLRATPGVRFASLAATVPFGTMNLGYAVRRADAPAATPALSCTGNIVSDDYFTTLGIPMLRGREFRENEPNPVAIIDQTAARRLFPAGDAIGQRVRLSEEKPPKEVEIVGIAGNTEESVIGFGGHSGPVADNGHPHIYLPFGREFQSDMNIHLGADAGAIDAIRAQIRAIDAATPVLALTTMRDHVDASFDFWIVRTAAQMFIVFGITALLLAAAGLYGVRAYTVARRTREIGIRIALGARPADARRMILAEGLRLTLLGAAAGLVLSLGAGTLLASILYKVSGRDPLVLACAAMVLILVSTFACWLPALRASRVDPIIALRQE